MNEPKALVWEIRVNGAYPCICENLSTVIDVAGIEGADEATLRGITIKPRLMSQSELDALPEHGGW